VDYLWIIIIIPQTNIFKSIENKLVCCTIINMSITYQPKKKKRTRTHGFLKRMRNKQGKIIMRNRRRKGRQKLTV